MESLCRFLGVGGIGEKCGVSFLDSLQNLSEVDKKFSIIEMLHTQHDEDLDIGKKWSGKVESQ